MRNLKLVPSPRRSMPFLASIACLALVSACATRIADAPASAAPVVSAGGDSLSIALGKDRLEIQAYAPNVLKLNFLPRGESSPETEVLSPEAGRAAARPPVDAKVDASSDPMTISTSGMTVKIRKDSLELSIYGARGELLLSGGRFGAAGEGAVNFSHSGGQNFYGISGFEATAPSAQGMLRNSGGPVKAGYQGWSGGPLVWSTSGYGLLVDSDGGAFAIDDATLAFSGCSKKNVECFVLLGKPAELMSALADISGRAPLFPKWAMGFMNSQWGINQGELKEIVDTYRSKSLPIDAMILDFDWKAWGSDHYGEWNWNASNFPDGPSGRLKAAMDAEGIRLVGIMKPRIHIGGEQGAYAAAHKFWLPNRYAYRDYFSNMSVNDLDFSKAECRSWFFEHFKPSFDTGIVGWWNDEADGFNNFEFMDMERSLYEGQRGYSDQRVFSLNRNFYVGAQRYAYGLWSGDIKTGFDSMAAQRERMLSAVGLGEAKWGMDAGGFIGHPSPENYARWIEFSAFVPIFRVHGTYPEKRQPWRYGELAERAAAKAMALRYSLIPYIYSYERRAYEEGVGLVKPLYFDWPSDPKVANDRDAWMFGDYLLVSPVVLPGQSSKEVYLPEGRWLDYFSGKAYRGGQTVGYPLSAGTYDDIPLFIKSGAIIPSREPESYVGEAPGAPIYLDVFPDPEPSSFDYYDDDGSTYGYEGGRYYKQVMRTQAEASGARLSLSAPKGGYRPETPFYICRVHGIAPSSVSLDGRELPKASSLDELLKGRAQGWIGGADRYGAVLYAKVAAGREAELLAK
jgi:alpha-glucosidase